MSRNFNILHLSDLHFNTKRDHQRLDIAELMRHIEEELNYLDDSAVDLVIVSGDMLDWDQWTNEAALCELDALLATLEEKLPMAKFVFVPGNHDLSLFPADDKIDAMADDFKSWHQDGKRKILTPDSQIRDSHRELLGRSSMNYQEWYSRNTQPKPDNEILGLIPGDRSFSIAWDERKIGILCLNSAFLCAAELDRGALDIAIQQIEGATGNYFGWCNQHDLVLIVTHHPLNAIHPSSRPMLEAYVRASAHVYFCGDFHETAQRIAFEAGGAPMMREAQATTAIGTGTTRGYAICECDVVRGWLRFRVFEQAKGSRHLVPAPLEQATQEWTPYRKGALPRLEESETNYADFRNWVHYVPKRIFPESRQPNLRAVQTDHFFSKLADAESYRYLGDSGTFTTVQLHSWFTASQRPHLKLEFVLPAPTVDVLKRWSDVIEGDRRTAAKRVEEIWVTVFGLTQIRSSFGNDVTIKFIEHPPLYRMELVGNGVYLNYYRLGGRYGTTLYYSKVEEGASLWYKAATVAMHKGGTARTAPANLYRGSIGGVYQALRDTFKVIADRAVYIAEVNREKNFERIYREVTNEEADVEFFRRAWIVRLKRHGGR